MPASSAPSHAAARRIRRVRRRATSPRAHLPTADRPASSDGTYDSHRRGCARYRARRARYPASQRDGDRACRGNQPAGPPADRAAPPAPAGHTPNRRSPGSADSARRKAKASRALLTASQMTIAAMSAMAQRDLNSGFHHRRASIGLSSVNGSTTRLSGLACKKEVGHGVDRPEVVDVDVLLPEREIVGLFVPHD